MSDDEKAPSPRPEKQDEDQHEKVETLPPRRVPASDADAVKGGVQDSEDFWRRR